MEPQRESFQKMTRECMPHQVASLVKRQEHTKVRIRIDLFHLDIGCCYILTDGTFAFEK